MTVATFLKALLPVNLVNAAEQVPAAVQAEIDKVNKDAAVKVAALRAVHSVQTVNSNLSSEIAAVQAFAARHIQLLKDEASAKVTAASNVLPPVSAQLGPTGATGPSS